MKHSRTAAALVAFAVVAAAGCGSNQDVANKSASSQTTRRQAATAFVTFSKHGPDRVPWANHVTYSIGGVAIGTFAPGSTVRARLKSCPRGQHEIEGRACPVSPLDTVSRLGSAVVVETALPEQIGCNRFQPPTVPSNVAADSVSVRPPVQHRDCASDFAVTLYFDSANSVAWLDFTLSGP